MSMILLLILFIVICESISQCLLKKFYMCKYIPYFIGAMVLYGIICYLLVRTYEFEDLGLVNALWSAASVIAVILVGKFVFHEKNDYWQYLGIALIIIGIILIKTTE
jgi:multidrug transporter EmrE-like cation transporter